MKKHVSPSGSAAKKIPNTKLRRAKTINSARNPPNTFVKLNIPPVMPNIPSTQQIAFSRPIVGAGIYTPTELTRRNLRYKFYAIANNELILSFAELIINNTSHVIEIYNLFTHVDYRGRRLAGKILDQIKEDYPGYTLWLGIDQAVGNVTAKARLYQRHQFTSNIKLTNVTSFGQPIGRKIIQLVYKPGKLRPRPNTKTVNKVLALRNRPLQIRLNLPRVFLNRIQEFRTATTEYGGAIHVHYTGFRNTHYTYNINQQNRYILPGTVTQYETHIPPINVSIKLLINWHTHPTICYRTEETCLGLPSGPDITGFLRSFITSNGKQICTFVFAEEGIYVVYMNPACRESVLALNQTNLTTLNTHIARVINDAQRHQFLNKTVSKQVFGMPSRFHGYVPKWTFFQNTGSNGQPIPGTSRFNRPKRRNNTRNRKRGIITNYKTVLEGIEINNIPIFGMQLIDWGTTGPVHIDLPYIFAKNVNRNATTIKAIMSRGRKLAATDAAASRRRPT